MNSDRAENVPSRREQAFDQRVRAARLARARAHPPHRSNGDEDRFLDQNRNPTFIGSYTKGLPHDRNTGLIAKPSDFGLFVAAINSGDLRDIRKIPLGPQDVPRRRRFQSGIATARENPAFNPRGGVDTRAWESMAAGLAFDLEGPDAQAVTMPPAPALRSDELVTEMTENYWMALLRDVEFTNFDTNRDVKAAIRSLNQSPWVQIAMNNPGSVSAEERERLRGPFDTGNVFRGNTEGDDVGPYISQFLLIGNKGLGNIHDIEDGFIQYGATRIDQRVRVATPKIDYMTTWEAFLDVQNGADLRGSEVYSNGDNGFRFITTPRDLCTYVHVDALYQAYLDACIIMLSMRIPFDDGIPFGLDDDRDKQQGFAHFGGPHILSLVTEVATRTLKAVRFQKFNTHRRLRPEAVGGLIERIHNDPENPLFAGARHLYSSLDSDLLDRVASHNAQQNKLSDYGNPRSEDFSPTGSSGETRLLPMAFPEGSPMHPSYGAGHASVAGACVTVLKAFFKHTEKLPFAFVPTENGRRLKDIKEETKIDLTIEGELNKLASNISIGRNWAGVHYYTDYRESIRLGEEVALGILQEQALTFREKFSMTVPLFFSDVPVRIEN